MKNREKFKNGIKSAVETGSTCAFVRDFVKPKPFDLSANEFCEKYNCHGCSKLFAVWLDEEYEEPEVDWGNVPVDTLVRVRNVEGDPWVLQYFKEFDEKKNYKFIAWSNGRTSKTADGRRTCWKYCELADDEESDE